MFLKEKCVAHVLLGKGAAGESYIRVLPNIFQPLHDSVFQGSSPLSKKSSDLTVLEYLHKGIACNCRISITIVLYHGIL